MSCCTKRIYPKRICIFSGTFNPVHTAHLIIAQAIKEEIGADKVLLIPAFIPPHRDNDIAPPEDRMNMLKLAVAGNPDFEVSDIEYRRGGKSYTYLTVSEIIKTYTNSEIDFVIGTDAFAHIDSWYEAEKLVKLVKFIIIPREENFNSVRFFEKIKLRDEINYEVVKIPFMEISSSYVRSRIKSGKSVKYLVPQAVEEYINEHNLFK